MVGNEIDPELERVLAASRPRPRTGFADELERGLFPAARERRARRPILAAAGLTGALATVAVAFGLAGAGPLSLSGDKSVEAGQKCHYETVTQIRRVPRVVTTATGTSKITTRKRPVELRVKRCS
jgi:hypothetical protein